MELLIMAEKLRGWRRAAAAAVGVLLSSGLVGCQAHGPRATGPLDVPRDSSAELVTHIADEPYVTAEAGYRAIYALAHGEMYDGEFDELTEVLRGEYLIDRTWDYPPELYLQKGTIGYMVCRACGIRTGLNWVVTALGRYAWRELQYRMMVEGGGEYGLMSGGEFVGLLLRAEDLLRRADDADAAPVELGEREG
jgi:hypothetical protein